MEFDGPLSSDTEATAAMEDWLTSSGAFHELDSEEPTQATQKSDAKPPAPKTEEETEEEEEEVSTKADEAEDDEADPKTSEEPADEEITSLEALAAYMEVEESDILESIQVTSPGGDTVTLSDALSRWETAEASVEARKNELEDEFATARQAADEQVTKHVQQLAAVTEAMIRRAKADYAPDKMQALREQDPERYIEMLERKQQVDAEINEAIEAVGAAAKHHQSTSQEDIQKLISRENAKLLSKRPEWKDENVREKAMRRVTKYLKGVGFEQSDIDQVMDHRMLLVIDDAAAAHELRQGAASKEVEVLKKKGLKKPTTGLRSQSRRDAEDPKNKLREAARARLKKSGDARDAAQLIEGIIF